MWRVPGWVATGSGKPVKRAKVALVLSLAVLILVGILTLSGSPMRVVRVGAKSEESLGTTTGSTAVCQADETLPDGVSAIRLGLEASFGPKVLLRVYSGSRILVAGSRAADWTSSTVTVQVRPLEHSVSPVKLCFYVPANSGRLQLYGAPAGARQTVAESQGAPLAGRVSVEYMAPGHDEWWSRVLAVARHMGIGHAVSGTWVALLVGVLMTGVCALAIALAWRELP